MTIRQLTILAFAVCGLTAATTENGIKVQYGSDANKNYVTDVTVVGKTNLRAGTLTASNLTASAMVKVNSDSADKKMVDAVAGTDYVAPSALTTALALKQDADADLAAFAAISAVQGDIVYHNGTSWVRLAAGISGYVLSSQGAGANPVWVEASGGAIDFSDLTGSATDAQIPNNITVDLATSATTANAGDSATSFFSSGTIEDARLPASMADKTFTGSLTVPDNSIALGTKTTGNYAAGDAEAGAATSGDSATAFFSSGEIEIARLPSELLTTTEGDAAYVPVARTVTAGPGLSGGGDLSANRTFTLDGSTFVNNFTLWDGSQATRTLTMSLSGGTDPVITAANNSLSLNVPFTASSLFSSGGSLKLANSDGNITLSGQLVYVPPGTRIGIGGASSSFPSLKRVNNSFQFRLADDSGNAPITVADNSTLTVNAGTVTGSGTASFETHTGTWNTSGNVTGRLNNYTNTASGSGSLIEDWQVSNVSVAKITKAGQIQAASTPNTAQFSFIGNTGSGLEDDTFNNVYIRANGGRILKVGSDGIVSSVGLGLGSASAPDVFLNRDAAATMQLGADAATATAQKIKAHDGSGTDKAGADFSAGPGNGTGTGKSGAFKVPLAPFGTTGSSQNTPVDRFIVAPEITLTDAATSAFEIALPTLRTAGGVIRWTIEAGDGTDVQSRSGVTTYSVVNKAGTYTKQLSTPGTETESVAASSGTLTGAWSILDGSDKVTLQFTPAGSLTETTYRLYFTIENNGRQAITLL